MIKPVTSEKAVRLLEAENTLVFQADRKTRKPEIKKEVEETFSVKVENMRTLLRQNKKYVYVKLKSEFKAIDVATKLGMI